MNDNSTVTGNIYIWGKLIHYSGPIIDSEDLELPDDMKIELWPPSPGMAHLTIMGVKVAGPSRLELLKSFAFYLCSDPSKKRELTRLRWEVKDEIERAPDQAEQKRFKR